MAWTAAGSQRWASARIARSPTTPPLRAGPATGGWKSSCWKVVDAAVAIRALTLDLDDTLWPVWPAIERAEFAVQEWLAEHAPGTARGFPLERMRQLRDAVARDNPGLAHDFT